MKTILNTLIQNAVNNNKISKQNIIVELNKNNIAYTEGYDETIEYIMIYDINHNNLEKFEIAIQDSELLFIVKVYNDYQFDTDCSVDGHSVYDKNYHEMYDLIYDTLYEIAKEDCEINFSSLQNTLENFTFKNKSAESKLDFVYLNSAKNNERIIKIGLDHVMCWQFQLGLTRLPNNIVKINYIKDHIRDYFIYGSE